MKKLLGTILALLLLVVLIVEGLTSCQKGKSKEAEYIEFCKTDSVVVGYQYLFLGKDSTNKKLSVFNPRFKKMLIKYDNLTYAKMSDFESLEGYWLFLRLKSRDVPELPLDSREIKTPREAEWEEFIEWRDGK